jgi:hypothetical protein
MSKLICEPVVTHPGGHTVPKAFIWRKRLYQVVEVFDWWREPTKWWEGETIRFLIRVNAKHSSVGTYELCLVDEKWFLNRIYD